MRRETFLASALLAAGTMAAPTTTEVNSISMMADGKPWIITSMNRPCDVGNTVCTWVFGINDGATNTPCSLLIHGTPASQTNGGPVTCGAYTVTSGWSGQFGPGQGFTTLAVVQNAQRLIVYPSYTDNQVASGAVVVPDQQYIPQALPPPA